jgi:hypothetical protein
MSVFTTVTQEQSARWPRRHSIGTPIEPKGIEAGIDDTSDFVTTTQARHGGAEHR